MGSPWTAEIPFPQGAGPEELLRLTCDEETLTLEVGIRALTAACGGECGVAMPGATWQDEL